jgi:hypothetical protein
VIALAPRPPRRPRALRVVQEPMWMPREGLPAGGRDECRHGERPCPYVKCEWHLWMVDGRDRPGRSFTGGKLGSTLRPRWLEYPTPPCCALDIIELYRTRVLPLDRIALAIGMTEDGARELVARALRKLMGLKEWVEP